MTRAMNPADSAAEKAALRLGQMLDVMYAWDQDAATFMSSTDETEDIIVVHDSRGRLIDLDVREGLQRELTIDELNEQISEAIASNADRAAKGIDDISERLFAECIELATPQDLSHPVAGDLVNAYNSSKTPRRK